MKKKNLIYGLFLILAATLILMINLDLSLGFIVNVPVVDILMSLMIMILCVSRIIHKQFWIIPICFSAIFMIFEKEIAEYFGFQDSNIISNWVVLLFALLFAAGIKLITSSIIGKENSVKLSAQTKYINCKNFNKEKIKVFLGSAEVYFENIESYKGNGILDIKCNMGNLEIHIPSSWNLVTDIDTVLGNTEIMPGNTEIGPLLTVKGTCSKGNIDILRV